MKIRMALSLALLLVTAIFTHVANAQEEEGVDCQHPRVVYLVEKTGATCQELLDLQAAGVGFGQIVKAAVVAEGLPAYEGDWRALLAAHQSGAGWGAIARAYGLAGGYAELGISGEELLALKDSGLGWGQISRAQALATAELGVSFEQAVEMMQSGLEWEEIRTQLGLPQGPPPWAGGNRKEDKEQQGPPPHAQGQGNDGGNAGDD
ncbi:MAG: hypothetical protein L0332_17635 [Chloroflexi bacterium]|nr:hypothetical protein [Chloroflexota bacterium]MCI0579289.1 hypothetical protein [Chloroflexota bacterium]MCI0644351.1 hypothetical protein [Chloroflexota bacterium]MCI0728523.1 hypothetical protein [Chloroflexota bacterium]